MTHAMRQVQRGFGTIVAIVVLLILVSLATAMLTFGTTQQTDLAEDVLSARALAAARTGTDVGLFKAISTTTPGDVWKTCNNLTPALNLNLLATTGFYVTVTCNSWSYFEGETVPGTPNPVRLFLIQATACNTPNPPPLPPLTSCPDASAAITQGYIERVRTVTATN